MMKRSVLVLACALAMSCGAAKHSAQAPASSQSPTVPPAEAGTASPLDGDPRGQIERLSAQVEEERTQMGLPEPQMSSPAAPPAQKMSIVPLSTDESCKPAKTERCDGSCKISDSICGNAARICELAESMPGDGWAAGKCARAKETCDTAHDRCCSCQ
jgi:hypothetical protein